MTEMQNVKPSPSRITRCVQTNLRPQICTKASKNEFIPCGSEDYHLKASLCSHYGASVRDLIPKMPSLQPYLYLCVFCCHHHQGNHTVRLLHVKLTINMLAINIYLYFCRRWLPLIYLPVGDTAQWKCSNVTLQPFNNIKPLFALCIMCRTDIHTHIHMHSHNHLAAPVLKHKNRFDMWGGRLRSAVRVYM